MAGFSLVVPLAGDRSISYHGHLNPPRCYVLCADGSHVLSYARPSELHLWRVSDGEQLFIYSLEKNEEFDVSIDGNWLTTRLMVDSGNAQQEYFSLYYLGQDASSESFASSFDIWLDISNGLDYWFSDDCQTLWTQGEWNTQVSMCANGAVDDEQDEEFECLRSYSLNHKQGLPIIEMLSSEELNNDKHRCLPEDLTNTSDFVLLDKAVD